MQSKWSDAEARSFVQRYRGNPHVNEAIALRVYSSRLIGSDPTLVLHGGGNTSVKTRLEDDTGEMVDVLCVKGSGWNLASIEPEGLPAVRLGPLQALRHRESLSDEEMVNAQRTRLLDASAPNPSVETLLHAFLPHAYIDHSHADAVLSLVDQPRAETICNEVFGGRLALVPYIMPGFALAKLAAEVYERDPNVEGLLLLQHGLFTFGDTARESYERHVDAVDKAEAFVRSRRWWSSPRKARRLPDAAYRPLATLLRGRLGEGQRHYVLTLRESEAIRNFVDSEHVAAISQRGVATPDHVLRTKNQPLILDVLGQPGEEALARHVDQQLATYRSGYRQYVTRQMHAKKVHKTPLDADPRVILVPGLGLIAAGRTLKDAHVAADIYEHTIDIIHAAEWVGRYQALEEGHIFDMEYWSLEQAKLGKRKPRPFEGQVVYITGAARGIGAATARAFASEGALLHLVDRDGERLASVAAELGASWDALDVADEQAVQRSVDRAVELYGGVDGLVSNAGVAPQGRMERLSPRALRDSFEVNLFAHQWAAAAVTRVLRIQGTGGFLLFNASKSAFNPGEGFGPYGIPKAGVVALMKQYAVEEGAVGIRSNAINADRVRTDLMSDSELQARARARGLETDEYFRSNLLRREVLPEDVAQAFVSLATAPSTTGCVFPVDGGNIAAAPR